MKVAIAGAGIGGLSVALALARRGHEVVVCERADDVSQLGAGLQISPNAARALDDLGVGSDFDRIAVRPSRLVIRRWQDDTELRSVPLGAAIIERYGRGYANVHRGELAAMLAAVLRRDHPDVRLLHDSAVEGVATDADGSPSLLLADGSAIDADVVVGADGIRSAVRTSLFGPKPSRFSGAVAYRALIPRRSLPNEEIEVTNRLGPGSHVVTYFIGADAQWLNLVCVVPEPVWDIESWTELGDADALLAEFMAWSPRLRGVLRHVQAPVYRWALYDRPPLERWGVGGVTLLGDACHPMLPFLAQGACQALEDAVVLADELDQVPDSCRPAMVAEALRRYEATRRPRTAKVQTASWRNRDLYHLVDGEEQRRRDAAYTAAGADLSAFDWLYGGGGTSPR